jgi:hypothetical protein
MATQNRHAALFQLILMRTGVSYLTFLLLSLFIYVLFNKHAGIDLFVYLVVVGSVTIWLPVGLSVAFATWMLHLIQLPLRFERGSIGMISSLLLTGFLVNFILAKEFKIFNEYGFLILGLLSLNIYTANYLNERSIR